jgi:NADH-quinone oxidoreductase subunit M
MNIPYLSILILLPLIGIVFLSLIRGDDEAVGKKARQVALLISIVEFLFSAVVLYNYDYRNPYYQFEEQYVWFQGVDITYHLGLDGLSIYFVLLTTLLMPLCIMASWDSIKYRMRSFMIALMALQSLIIGMFCAIDLVIFYICFEGVLIPMFFIIGIWGGVRRYYASFKLFLYTLLGSVFMLIVIIRLYLETSEFDLLYLQNVSFPPMLEKWLFIGFMVAFAVKIPMFPVHTWLPDAHTEAPTAGSVILAGVLLKMGGYGILRICLPLFPEASIEFAPYVIVLSLIAIIYTSLVALAQTDIKKLIAYSSVAHMGFVTLGIFHFNAQSMGGAVVQMVSHGIISAALFLCVGIIYDRFHTRAIADYGGLNAKMPWFGTFFLLFTLASAGLPGTSGFVGEFMVILGTFKAEPIYAMIAATGMVLSASYGLWLYKRICHGPLTTKLDFSKFKHNIDLSHFEWINLSVLAVLAVYFGIHAQPLFALVNPSIKKIQEIQADILNPSSSHKRVAKIDKNADLTREQRKRIK